MANVKIISASDKTAGVVRVAAYCRVSSDSSDQLNSYATQIRAYSALINDTAGWQLVDIYADEGLTGTKLDKREDFKRMMRDCQDGKIDKILVKSISRFARNTYDCLASLRVLKTLGVQVYFEKENIDTAEITDELAVTVFGSLAQEESVSISQNQRWSYKKRMEAGEFITCTRPYGYKIVNGKQLEIVDDEAETVRWMFRSYLNGMGSKEISDELNRRGLTTSYGKHWRENAVRYILTNEKYIGDSLTQKKYTVDSFPTKKTRNKGMQPKFYVENTHAPIISKDEFERAQRLMSERRRGDYTMKEYVFTRKIICAECGSKYTRLVSKAGAVTWVCRKHIRGKTQCSQVAVPELEINEAFIRVLRTLKTQKKEILDPALVQFIALRDAMSRSNPEMVVITTELAKLSEQEHVVTQLKARGLLDAEAYLSKCNDLNGKIAALRKRRRDILNCEDDNTIDQIKLLTRTIENAPDKINEFDENLFLDTVEQIIAEKDGSITFVLIGGFKFNEKIWRVIR